MNQIERLRNDLTRRFPTIAATLDHPADERGAWFLDVHRGADLAPIVVEWRPDRGFGLSTPDEADFGVGPDEVYPNAQSTFERVATLIQSQGRTAPPQALRLSELRQRLGFSQAELAAKAGVKQANISRIEHRGDILLSTLARIIEATGSRLSVRVVLPDGSEHVLDLSPPSGNSMSGRHRRARPAGLRAKRKRPHPPKARRS